jgi:hypothetical protein
MPVLVPDLCARRSQLGLFDNPLGIETVSGMKRLVSDFFCQRFLRSTDFSDGKL